MADLSCFDLHIKKKRKRGKKRSLFIVENCISSFMKLSVLKKKMFYEVVCFV